MNLNRYTPGEAALGWTDRGQSLLFTHQSFYVAGIDDFDVDCSTTGIYALDLRSGRITRRAPAPREKNGSSEGNRETRRPMSLGADAARVRGMILGEGGALLLSGVALGLVGALFATEVLRSLLFGITPRDPLTLGASVIGLAVVGLLACWIPATRAAHVDPAITLRTE